MHSRDYRGDSGSGYVAAGMFGALAALGAVAALILSKRENRERLMEKVDEMRNGVDEVAREARMRLAENADEFADRAKTATSRIADAVKDGADQAADTARKTADKAVARVRR